MSRHRRARRRQRTTGAIAVLVGCWVFLTGAVGSGPATLIMVLAAVAVPAALFVVPRAVRRAQRTSVPIPIDVDQVDQLTGPQFEQLVGALLVRDGFTNVRAGGGGGDLNRDVAAWWPGPGRPKPLPPGVLLPAAAPTVGWPWLIFGDPGTAGGRLAVGVLSVCTVAAVVLVAVVAARRRRGLSVVAQCKRQAVDNPVRSPKVQEFLGTFRYVHGADVGVFVTTSRFTDAAWRLGQNQGLVMVDRDGFAQWLAGRPLRVWRASPPPVRAAVAR